MVFHDAADDGEPEAAPSLRRRSARQKRRKIDSCSPSGARTAAISGKHAPHEL
jgi:hypothetical protein